MLSGAAGAGFVERSLAKVQALIRGHQLRKLQLMRLFLIRVTGKPLDQIKQSDVSKVPVSSKRTVILKEKQIGQLRLSEE